MLHDSKAIPQKGKARENKTWQAGWWDFQPLAERSFRPLEWSQSSIIFCAHPVQPLITARHFSSSKQFVISPPAHVVSAPTSYCPPSLISVAPNDDWLFAYFPGRSVEGMGVLWFRGPEIDNWTIKESWPIAHGAAPVAASWLGQAREWVSGITPGSVTRLPPRGPRPPVSDPTLLLVNQNQNITVCYLRQYVPSLRFLTCSTAQRAVTGEGHMLSADPSSTGIKQCFKAAIGLGYNECSVLIAMRSHYVSSQVNHTCYYNTINPNLPEAIKSPSPLELLSVEWENWGEETVINLFEVQFLYNGERFGLSAEPLQPILGCDKPLIGLDFICLPPSLDALNPASPRKANERPLFYLVSSYLDFENYGSTPKSELVSHSITKLSTPVPVSLGRVWKIQRAASRSFTSSIVGYVLPPPIRPHLGQQDIIFAGILDISVSLPSAHTNIRRAPIGNTKALNLADLMDHDEYEASPILSDVTRLGQDIPLNAVLSPNGVALATISSSSWPLRTSVQSVPQMKGFLSASEHRLLPLAPSLADSVISGRASTDISHLLSHLSTPFDDILETIYQADQILDDQSSDFSHSSTLGILGTIIEIYRERTIAIKSSTENLTARWKTAHELCSLVACNQAFDDCKDGDTYDLDAVWQLIGLSTWIVSLTESLLKECVMSSKLDSNDAERGNNGGASTSSTSLPLDSPVLLHISHPFFLDNFLMALSHVERFCAYVKSLTARGETAQIARDIAMDLISDSGIDISALITTLEQTRQEVRSLERESCRRALVSCQPTSDMHQILSRTVSSVTQPFILTKATLFVKPHDLVDGLGNLSTAPKKDTDKDVISKKSLTGVVASMTCSQCEGKTALADGLSTGGSVPLPWRAWEKKWVIRCICGGRWKNTPIVL